MSALFDLGARLREQGNPVAVFLVQNAVFALRQRAELDRLLARGVQVWADEYSITARGLDPAARPDGVRLGGAGELVRLLMADGTTPVWH